MMADVIVVRKFKLGTRVRKVKGSSWHGRVVGFYSTDLTPVGYAVESETEKGSVQIYPESALERVFVDKVEEAAKLAFETAHPNHDFEVDLSDNGVKLWRRVAEGQRDFWLGSPNGVA